MGIINQGSLGTVLGMLAVSLMAAPVVRAEEAASPADGGKPEAVAGTYCLQPKDVVLFLGNSITDMSKPEVEFLMADLKKQYPTLAEGDGKVKMVLSGSGGDIASGGLKRLPRLMEAHKPTVCVIGYGTNEARWQNEAVHLIPPMQKIIKQLKEAKVAIFVVAPPPMFLDELREDWKVSMTPAEARMPKTVEMLRKLAADEGVFFVDAFVAFKAAAAKKEATKKLTVDGVHPNQDGFRVMADVLQKAWGFGKPLAAAGSPRPVPVAAPDSGKEGGGGTQGPPAKTGVQGAK